MTRQRRAGPYRQILTAHDGRGGWAARLHVAGLNRSRQL